MPAFNKFKTRYIFLDYWLISLVLAVPVIFISSIFQVSYTDLSQTFSIPSNIIHVVFYTLLCLAIIYRLQQCQVSIKPIVGSIELNRTPWLLLLIIFYAEKTLTSGINYLEYYFANLFTPNLLESTVNNITVGSKYGSESLLLQIVHYLLLLFVLVVVAPVTEEFIFRGVFLHRWSVKWGVFWSVILSSLLFGAIHFDIFWFSRAVGSIFTALFYIQTGNLLVAVIIHALQNGLVFVDLLFYHFHPSANSELNITVQYIWYGLVNILFALPVLIYFLKFPKKPTELPYFSNKNNQKHSAYLED